MHTVDRMEVFVTVVDLGSLVRASQALSLTRPRVTNVMKELETEIGARLLNRTTRRVSLTAEGEIFYDNAMQVLSNLCDARNLFGGSDRTPAGRLRIDVPNSIAKPLLIPRLTEFRKHYPDINLILGVGDQPVDLYAEGVDAVLRVGDLPSSSMVSRTVGRAKMITVASPGYLEKHGVPVSVADLNRHQALVYFSGRNKRTLEWQLEVDGEMRSFRLKPALMVNDGEAFVACAVNGLGLAQVLKMTVADELASGKLVPVLPNYDAGTRTISALYLARRHLAPQVRAFIDWTTGVFAEADPGLVSAS